MSTMKRVLLAAALVAAIGCSDDDGTAAGPDAQVTSVPDGSAVTLADAAKPTDLDAFGPAPDATGASTADAPALPAPDGAANAPDDGGATTAVDAGAPAPPDARVGGAGEAGGVTRVDALAGAAPTAAECVAFRQSAQFRALVESLKAMGLQENAEALAFGLLVAAERADERFASCF
jgi:hypothetical protein